MNGKLDLTRSESVMELVSAKTDTGRRHAVNRLSGALENEINAIKTLLVEALAAAEIFLDYSEDEIGADNDEAAGILRGRPQAEEALDRLQKLAASWQRERIYQEGVLAVIAGRPNAGKSSLFNLLIKEERAIVTEIPGTTRDWIEAWVSIEGIPVRLADTAGLRESADPVEKIGVERSRELLAAADLVLYLIDGEEGVTDEDRAFIEEFAQCSGAARNTAGGGAKQKPPLLLIWNKADLVPPCGTTPAPHMLSIAPNAADAPPLSVSAKTGAGIAELCRAIAAAITAAFENAALPMEAAANSQSAALGSQRQKELVEAAAAAVEEALYLADREEPLDLIAPLLREAVNALGEITGEVSTADILEMMFGKFCVGK
jgi:tRNA modification GTPase